MIFTPTEIPGAFVVDLSFLNDERGFFARQWCAQELRDQGLVDALSQTSLSHNRRAHTLRGMHYAEGETKLVHCPRGALFDVIVDLRSGPTQKRWLGLELSASNHRMLYIPDGVAHGFLTLEDSTEVQYFISKPYDPAASRGVRFDDPAFAIRWPSTPEVIAIRDRQWPDFAP